MVIKVRLEKGMTFTARFHLIDRTSMAIIDLTRVDDWFNPKIKITTRVLWKKDIQIKTTRYKRLWCSLFGIGSSALWTKDAYRQNKTGFVTYRYKR